MNQMLVDVTDWIVVQLVLICGFTSALYALFANPWNSATGVHPDACELLTVGDLQGGRGAIGTWIYLFTIVVEHFLRQDASLECVRRYSAELDNDLRIATASIIMMIFQLLSAILMVNMLSESRRGLNLNTGSLLSLRSTPPPSANSCDDGEDLRRHLRRAGDQLRLPSLPDHSRVGRAPPVSAAAHPRHLLGKVRPVAAWPPPRPRRLLLLPQGAAAGGGAPRCLAVSLAVSRPRPLQLALLAEPAHLLRLALGGAPRNQALQADQPRRERRGQLPQQSPDLRLEPKCWPK